MMFWGLPDSFKDVGLGVDLAKLSFRLTSIIKEVFLFRRYSLQLTPIF